MSTFSADIKINAPVDNVWAALADIGSISQWNLGVVSSHTEWVTQKGVNEEPAAKVC